LANFSKELAKLVKFTPEEQKIIKISQFLGPNLLEKKTLHQIESIQLQYFNQHFACIMASVVIYFG
jgi:hypothetical protein